MQGLTQVWQGQERAIVVTQMLVNTEGATNLRAGGIKGKRWCYQNLEALMGDPPRLVPGPLWGLLRGGCLGF